MLIFWVVDTRTVIIHLGDPVTPTKFYVGLVVRTISGSGEWTLFVLLCEDDFGPAALGFLYMSYNFCVKLRNADRC